MDIPGNTSRVVRFGVFELDLRAGELRKLGVKVKLQDQPFRVLVMLLEHAGDVVTREQLFEKLWSNDTFVDFERSLNAAVTKLRQALGDSADNPRFVETLARRGYRFLAPVIEGADGADSPVSRLEVQGDSDGSTPGAVKGQVQLPPMPSRQWTWQVLPWAFFVFAAIALLALATVHFRQGHSGAHLARLQIPLPDKATFGPPHELGSPEVSPDGRHIVLTGFGSDGKSHAWLRSLDSAQFRLLPATGEWLGLPFWSPDSRFVAFFFLVNSHLQLKKLDIATGQWQTLCNRPEDTFGEGSWSRDGVILFSMADSFAGNDFQVYRVSAAGGGEVRPVRQLDTSRHEQGLNRPQFLPDGRHFLYHSWSSISGQTKHAVYVGSLDSRETTLVTSAPCVRYTPPGFLIYGQEQTLFAQRFDIKKLRLAGEPFPIADHVGHPPDKFFCRFSASENGTLVYPSTPSSDTQLTWYSRDGGRLESIGKPGPFDEMRLSPDETRVAVQQADPHTGKPGIRVMEISTGILTAVTSNQAAASEPVWSPNGRELVFTSDQGDRPGLYKKFVGREDDELLLASQGQWDFAAMQWLPDQSILLRSIWDFYRLPLSDKREPQLLLKTEHGATLPQVSPDGRLVAYQSDESVRSGQFEIYLAAFPSFGDKRQVSNATGCQPLWRKDGKELFYLSLDGKVMSVDVTRTPRLGTSEPRALFQTPGPVYWRFNQYCVTGDGKRFIFGEPVGEANKPINVVLNWTAGLNR